MRALNSRGRSASKNPSNAVDPRSRSTRVVTEAASSSIAVHERLINPVRRGGRGSSCHPMLVVGGHVGQAAGSRGRGRLERLLGELLRVLAVPGDEVEGLEEVFAFLLEELVENGPMSRRVRWGTSRPRLLLARIMDARGPCSAEMARLEDRVDPEPRMLATWPTVITRSAATWASLGATGSAPGSTSSSRSFRLGSAR